MGVILDVTDLHIEFHDHGYPEVAVEDFDGDVAGLGEAAVHEAIVRRESGRDAHGGKHRQNQQERKDTFH